MIELDDRTQDVEEGDGGQLRVLRQTDPEGPLSCEADPGLYWR